MSRYGCAWPTGHERWGNPERAPLLEELALGDAEEEMRRAVEEVVMGRLKVDLEGMRQ